MRDLEELILGVAIVVGVVVVLAGVVVYLAAQLAPA
jgi:hypothetical protein